MPMSIVIVGIGDEDFDSMRKLEGDRNFLEDNYGNKATRNIVKFVAFRDVGHSATRLIKEVLDKIPSQAETWF